MKNYKIFTTVLFLYVTPTYTSQNQAIIIDISSTNTDFQAFKEQRQNGTPLNNLSNITHIPQATQDTDEEAKTPRTTNEAEEEFLLTNKSFSENSNIGETKKTGSQSIDPSLEQDLRKFIERQTEALDEKTRQKNSWRTKLAFYGTIGGIVGKLGLTGVSLYNYLNNNDVSLDYVVAQMSTDAVLITSQIFSK